MLDPAPSIADVLRHALLKIAEAGGRCGVSDRMASRVLREVLDDLGATDDDLRREAGAMASDGLLRIDEATDELPWRYLTLTPAGLREAETHPLNDLLARFDEVQG